MQYLFFLCKYFFQAHISVIEYSLQELAPFLANVSKKKLKNANLHFFSAIEADAHLVPPSLPFNSPLNSAGPLPDLMKQKNFDTNAESAKAEECASTSSGERANLANSYDKPTDNGTSSLDQTSVDQSCTPTSNSGVDPEQNDRALKPSKIPVLKVKHAENSGNDASSSRSPSREEYDAGRMLSAYSSIPTSPVTGKKYRSPLSAPVKPLDRSRKLTNGNSSSNSPCDNAPTNETNVARTNIVAPFQTSRNIVDVSNVASPATAVVKNESSSNQDISNHSTNDKSQGDTNINTESFKEHAGPASNETPSSERKPKFKWMFGPHKNANVVGSSGL